VVKAFSVIDIEEYEGSTREQMASEIEEILHIDQGELEALGYQTNKIVIYRLLVEIKRRLGKYEEMD